MCWNAEEDKMSLILENPERGSAKNGDTEGKSYKNFELSEDWGESFSGKSDPNLVIVDFKSKSCERIVTPFAPAQPCWIDSEHVVCLGADLNPRKYGLVYCYNRRVSVYLMNVITKDCSKTRVSSEMHFILTQMK
jgi:hypothetical protein